MKQCTVTTLTKPITGYLNEPTIDRYILTLEDLKKDLKKLKQKPTDFIYSPMIQEVNGKFNHLVQAVRKVKEIK